MTGGDLCVDGVETIIDDDRWRLVHPDPERLSRACARAVGAKTPRVGGSGIAVLLADDAALRDLNSRFRGFDKPTNVLAFPAGDDGSCFLGDLAVAYETCVMEARARGVSPVEHAAHLIVHGILHLLGYDHLDDDEARRMEALESDIVTAMGYADPHADSERMMADEKGDAPA